MTEKLKEKAATLGKARLITALTAAVLTAATLIFIISNSARSAEASTEQSDAFKDIVEIFIPENTKFGKWVLDNIRKIAHFTEFGLLGIESAVLISALSNTRKKRLSIGGVSSFFGLLVAFIDETVQIFSERGPSVSDMWIDLGGFVFYAVLTYIGAEIFFAATSAARRRHSLPEGEN